MHEYYQHLANLLKQGSCTRTTILSGNSTGEESISVDGKQRLTTKQYALGETSTLVEELLPKPHLVIFGGGHVSLALYKLGVLQEMPMDIYDDRQEFANRQRFPQATVHCMPFEDIGKISISFPGAYVVIATHGHLFDRACLAYALRQPHAYIGMIGSKKKVAFTYDALLQEGFSAEELSMVHAPIGLPIGGDSPAEIAISIMAQIISIYAKDPNRVLIDPAVLEAAAECEGTASLVRVLEKSGSSPATPGAMMLVTESAVIGTVGGGSVEGRAIEQARHLTKNRIEEVDLGIGGDAGMVCGGKVKLLYTRLS